MAAELTADELRTQIQQEDDAATQLTASLQNEKRELSEAKARQALRRELEARVAVTANRRSTLDHYQQFRSNINADRVGELPGSAMAFGWQLPELTPTAPGPPYCTKGYAYPPPACCTYRRRRATCPVLYVLRTSTSLGRAVRTAYRAPPTAYRVRVPRTVWCTTGNRPSVTRTSRNGRSWRRARSRTTRASTSASSCGS